MKASKYLVAAQLLLILLVVPTIAGSESTDSDMGIIRIRYVTIVVRDYDEALRWYTHILGFAKTEEGSFGKDKRWIVVAPRGRKDIGIVLEIARPYSAADKGNNLNVMTGDDGIPDYRDRVGKETRWVLEVEDCQRFYKEGSKRGIKFVEAPVEQPWGVTEAMFEDLYGNIFVIESFRPKTEI